MYAVLTGHAPFAKADVAEVLVNILKESPVLPRRVSPTVDTDLEAVCMKCLEKRPEDRYASLEELAEQVAALESPAKWPWWKVW